MAIAAPLPAIDWLSSRVTDEVVRTTEECRCVEFGAFVEYARLRASLNRTNGRSLIMAIQDTSTGAESTDALITHTADIIVSYVTSNSIGVEQLPSLIMTVHETLLRLGTESKDKPRPDPAVSVRSSVKKDHLVCLEDGKTMKMLKRHLMAEHGLTPAAYRARWNLPNDYPLVASDYAKRRRDLALEIGLGRKPGQKRGRKAKA